MKALKPRKIIPKILNFIDDREVIVLHGSRQVGKTSVLLFLIENYLREKAGGNLFYFDLEDFSLLELCDAGPDDVMEYLRSRGADLSTKIYLLIDEIQYIDNPSSFLKLFHDRYHNHIKLIVSGSSSFLIRKKFKDSLVGRIIDFELFPLDFKEFLEFKGQKYSLMVEMPPAAETALKKLYEEFVIYGGYPAIVLENNTQKKEIKLKQIINSYIKRDIRDLAEIRELDKFNNLIKILSAQTGSLLNLTELSNTLSLSMKTVQEYLFLLENTYVLRRLRPFHRNIRSELTKMPKVYFEDTGLMNILSHKTFFTNITGALLENSVYSELRKNLDVESLYFWRTRQKQEVDFVVDYVSRDKELQLLALEIKTIFLNKHTSHIRYFMANYGLKKGYVCALSKGEKSRQKNIKVIYPWQVLNLFPSQVIKGT